MCDKCGCQNPWMGAGLDLRLHPAMIIKDTATGRITHPNYTATYTVIRRGTKYIHCRLHRDKGKLIVDRVLINEISHDWAPGETYTIKALHHDMPVLKGHRTYHHVIIEPQESIRCHNIKFE